MTLKDLEQFRYLRKEIVQLARRLDRLAEKADVGVFDTVKGSSHDKRNMERVFIIMGMGGAHRAAYAEVERLLKTRAKRLAEMMAAIDEFIDTIDRSDIRQIIDCRYLQGMTWAATSKQVYKYAHKDTARKALGRFFAKK